MPNFTIKNIPDDLYSRLKQQAAEHRRSINGEILYLIERSVTPRKLTTEEFLDRAAELRSRTKGPALSIEQIIEAKNQGRA